MRTFLFVSLIVSVPILALHGKPDSSTAAARTDARSEDKQHSSQSQNADEIVTSCSCRANEIMTDRCSAAVAFPPSYDAKPNAPGTVVLVRDKTGKTAWT